MAGDAGFEIVRGSFARGREGYITLAGAFVDDPEVVVEAAAELFEAMIPDMAYVDEPDRPMASAVFSCSAILSVYLVLANRGVDVHDFGAAFLEGYARQLAESPTPTRETEDSEGDDEAGERFAAAAEASQRDARPGEFVYEVVNNGDPDVKWAMNIQSCAICYQFAKHGAMELVPYMCASDDVASDHYGQGLRRTGTIALGAHHCDFRYHADAEPRRVADHYPQQIHVRTPRSP